MTLQGLYQELINQAQPPAYLLHEENLGRLVVSTQDRDETLKLVSPEDNVIRVQYNAERKQDALSTFEALRLPDSYPSNLGERTLWRLEGRIRETELPVTEKISEEDPTRLEPGLSKLVRVYSGREIDEDFYAGRNSN